MKPYFLLISISFIIYSCHNGNTVIFNGEYITINQFPKIQTPPSEKLNLEILGLNNISIIDTFLLAFKASGYNNFFEVYSTVDHSYLGKCLAKGRGPNEFLSIQYDENYYINNNDIILWISDGNLQKRAKLNLTQSLKTGKTVCDTIFRLTREDRHFYLDDTTTALIQYIPGNVELKTRNNRTQEIISNHKLLKSYVPPTAQPSVLSMVIAKHPTQNTFVACMLHFNQINIFTPDLQQTFSISYKEPVNIFHTINQPDSSLMMYYSTVIPTSEYIYALYINKKYNQFHYGKEPTEIQIFNWKGQAISKIIIPENIIYFTVDEKHQYIYGLKGNEELYRYKFKI